MKVISGGQAGVDRGGLLAALEVDLAVGGFCPRGRRAEDGKIPDLFSFLIETPETNYLQRTEWNIRDSRATYLLHDGSMGPGSKATIRMCKSWSRPCCVLDIRNRLSQSHGVDFFRRLTRPAEGMVINIAGPRESTNLGIQEASRRFCVEMFRAIMAE